MSGLTPNWLGSYRAKCGNLCRAALTSVYGAPEKSKQPVQAARVSGFPLAFCRSVRQPLANCVILDWHAPQPSYRLPCPKRCSTLHDIRPVQVGVFAHAVAIPGDGGHISFPSCATPAAFELLQPSLVLRIFGRLKPKLPGGQQHSKSSRFVRVAT